MDYFEHNMALLKEYRTPLYQHYLEFIEEKQECKYPCEQIEVLEAKDGTPILVVTRGGKKIRLNSPYRPIAEAEKWSQQFSFRNMRTNVLFFGMGNLIFANVVLQKLQEDGKLFVYEPNMEIFTTALHWIDMEKVICDERVFFLFEDMNPEEFYDFINHYTHWTNVKSQIVCHHTGYDQLFEESYLAFLRAIQKNAQMVRINKDTQVHFAKRAVTNSIRNMPYIKESRNLYDYIGKIPKEIPAILVAAGPSLDKNIEELRRAKGKAFIIAVDTAVRHLIRHNIMPDVMVTLDSGKPTNYISDPIVKDIPLFCGLEANHEILSFHTGIKIWFKGNLFLESLYERYGKQLSPYSPGGSVATAAFSICSALGFQKIIFVGQDLAYQGDITHAGGEVSGILNEEYGLEMIEGIDGKPIKSRYDWIIYLEWFEEAIRDIKDITEVIDATEGGAMIHGSKIMTLKEVVDSYCNKEINVQKLIEQQPPSFDEGEYISLEKELKAYSTEVLDMKNIAFKAQKACEEALDILNRDPLSTKMNRIQKEIQRANTAIEKKNIYQLMDIYISQVSTQYLEDVFLISDDSHKDEVHMYQSAQMIYKAIYDASKELYPEFQEVLN